MSGRTKGIRTSRWSSHGHSHSRPRSESCRVGWAFWVGLVRSGELRQGSCKGAVSRRPQKAIERCRLLLPQSQFVACVAMSPANWSYDFMRFKYTSGTRDTSWKCVLVDSYPRCMVAQRDAGSEVWIVSNADMCQEDIVNAFCASAIEQNAYYTSQYHRSSSHYTRIVLYSHALPSTTCTSHKPRPPRPNTPPPS